MRLLNTKTLELHEFLDNEIPQYAILSHTWEREEVLFQDMTTIGRAKGKYGFRKLQGACRLAHSQSFEYIWIDTCCIDKTSSAELTEAINSMFTWYKKAAVCYAFLSDVGDEALSRLLHAYGPVARGWIVAGKIPMVQEDDDELSSLYDIFPGFRDSRWFTRGWTLQELLAPPVLEFYSRNWHLLGNKTDTGISTMVSEVTGVDVHILHGGDISNVSIARRMFWASRRQTTRLEDRAYSLLGLFDVNMPLIYGEGKKAFRRLQEEILRISDDQSIFAWHSQDYLEGTAVDVLATSPSDFTESGALSRQPFHRVGREPTTITSQGISCQLPLLSVARLDTTDFKPFTEVDAILDCQLGNIPGTFPTIRLRSLPSKGEQLPKDYYRVIIAEMNKFEAYTIPTLLDESDILGLDPMQLHKDPYQSILDKTYMQWNLASIVFTRRFPPSLPKKDEYAGIPWSLSLLNDDYPPDCTDFWIVPFGTSWIRHYHVNVVHTYPQEKWDALSMQLRVLPIPTHLYNIGKFRIVDGVFNVEVAHVDYNPPPEVVSKALMMEKALIVGRQAGSRRAIPRPWCRILGRSFRSKDAVSLFDSSQGTPETNEWESERSVWVEGQEQIVLEAAVQTKEISGVYYHVVTIQVKEEGTDARQYMLDNELAQESADEWLRQWAQKSLG
ncbi:heterokaryon incompatibility protein-domain-containing protein [Immersiella caudata]|uniref:Heterokaryon incompatibility protein-domain-containing protein n=1 Tax=Immersiella caudata TaxID=314043 RepID=A0AA39WSR2_9PEZI|nr:heterokaryon incompatibility protein-domain-containing protein [Immersiella caudata]